MLSLHQSPSKLKWMLIVFASLIGLASLYYTNELVDNLAEREQEQIDLVAKAQELVVQVEDSLMLNFLVTDILQGNQSIPMIIADEEGNPSESRNIDFRKNANDAEKEKVLREHLISMKEAHPPIEVKISEEWKYYIYYENSTLLTQLKYFPYAQLSIITAFLIFAYFLFSSSRRAEQNRVWVGLAKETAHQLGTPLSALMAWVEYFRADGSVEEDILMEIEKDIARLTMITGRFSSIGSVPDLSSENVLEVTEGVTEYLKKRISNKVKLSIRADKNAKLYAQINKPLFEWVIENICKNAVDAMAEMGGRGSITLFFSSNKSQKQLILDITDTGKGIPQSQIKTVFRPGFTTKKRGWGLGLTLAKRIIEQYHNGKISVLKSEVGKGTTFRIVLSTSE
ncbi:sensor histidine kinase [Bernardetia sp.]|uniref:sensor histidine kinase n=1 Tax=Bernardetia sp. TaxID=1937974 RepID=UPI0025C48F55|nr:HAMP domain-containing sensor histidine kinase [Bernardetia sp.]